MTNKKPIAVTQAGAQASMSANMLAGGAVDQAALRQAAQAVPFEWKPGDVILDLYEVRKVVEGFGDNAREKDFHEGGFGRVYKVWHRTWLREMAVKSPRASVFTTQEQKDAFSRECETWVNLGLHAHIAACHYVRELGTAPRVFSEYATAGTLEDWIRSKKLYVDDKRAVLARILDVSIQFAWGLHYAHERGVIHQDVKPLNALMWDDGTLKVTDFGLAGARQKSGIADTAGGTRSIMVSTGGMTPSHSSPEQAAGRKLDRRTDIWSWAVSVLEIFQGEVTWQSGSVAAEALEAYIEDSTSSNHQLEFRNQQSLIPAMPEGVAELLRVCFQKNPGDRPRTLHDCATVLCKQYQSATGQPYPRAEPMTISDTADALNNRALSMLDLGKQEEADHIFSRALELDKHNIGATYNRGMMYWRAARCTDADILQSLEEIQQEHPNEASIECTKGWVTLENANFTQAFSCFENAAKLGGQKEARVWIEKTHTLAQIGAGQCLRKIREDGCRPDVVAFSLDGAVIISGGTRNSTDYSLDLWDVATGKCLRTIIGHKLEIVAVALSSDSKYVLSVGKDKRLCIWHVGTGKCVCQHYLFYDVALFVNAAAFSQDGRVVLVSSGDHWHDKESLERGDHKLQLFDTNTGSCLRIFKGNTKAIFSVAISPNGGQFALTGNMDDFMVRLWDVATGNCLRIFAGHKYAVDAIAFSPDGSLALSGSDDDTLRLWDLATGNCQRIFAGHTGGVRDVAFSPDGRFIISRSMDGTLRLWEADTGKCLRTFERHMPTNMAFSPDGRLALSVGNDSTLMLWDVKTVMERRYVSPWLYAMPAAAEESVGRQRLMEAHLSTPF